MKRYRLLLLSAALLLGSCVTAAGPMVGQAGREPTDEELVQDFLKVTFEDDNGFDWTYLRKFEVPVRVKVHGQPQADDIARIDWVIAEAARRGGVDIRRAADGDNANFHVYLSNTLDAETVADQMLKNDPAANRNKLRDYWFKYYAKSLTDRMVQAGLGGSEICYVHLWQHDHRPDLESAHVVIYTGQSMARRQRCIVEEMLQALGLVADTRKAWPSIFSPDQRLPDPSDYDWQYLRMLYDRRIHSGMVRDQARPQAYEIHREISQDQLTPPEQLTHFDPSRFVPANELILRTFMDVAYQRLRSNPRSRNYKPLLEMKILIAGDASRRNQAYQKVKGIFSSVAEHVGQMVTPTVNPSDGYQAAVSFNVRKNINEVIADMYPASHSPLSSFENRAWRATLEGYQAYMIYYGYARDWKITHFSIASFEDADNAPEAGFCFPSLAMLVNELRPVIRVPWQSSLTPFHNCAETLSPYDFLFIRLINDPRIRPGMREREAEPIFRQALSELRPDETRLPMLERLHLKNAPGISSASKR